MPKSIIVGKEFKREVRFEGVDIESRTFEIAFSSEEPVERWFGEEVLSHDADAVDLTRFLDGANLLFNHKRDDVLGVIENAWIGNDRVGRAKVRLGRDERGDWALAQINDGILTKSSVAYKIHLESWEERKDQPDLYTVTSWEPYELSIVTIPADPTVGVGRSADDPDAKREIAPLEGADPEAENPNSNTQTDESEGDMPKDELPKTPAKPTDTDAIRTEAQTEERARIATITKIGQQARGFDIQPFIENGAPADEVRAKAMDFMAEGNKRSALPVQPGECKELGLSAQERGDYSVLKLVRHLSDPGSQSKREAAAFEIEASEAAGGAGGNTAVIPMDIVGRALNTGTDGVAPGNTGGYLIGTEHRGDDMISQIYANSFAMSNATFLDGLIGDVDIPLENGLPTAEWIEEDSEADESAAGYGMLKLTPYTMSAKSLITRKMMIQTARSMELLLRNQLSKAVAIKADQTYFHGVASAGAPGGMANVNGINVVEHNGDPTHAQMVQMETLIADYTTESSARQYMLSRQIKGKLKTTKIDDGSGLFVFKDGMVNEYTAKSYDYIEQTHSFFGDPKHSYVGMWGEGLTIQVNEPREGTGTVPVTIFSDMDIKFPHPLTMTMLRKAAA